MKRVTGARTRRVVEEGGGQDLCCCDARVVRPAPALQPEVICIGRVECLPLGKPRRPSANMPLVIMFLSTRTQQVLAYTEPSTYFRPQRWMRLYLPYACRALPTLVVAFSGMAYFVDAVRDSTCSFRGKLSPAYPKGTDEVMVPVDWGACSISTQGTTSARQAIVPQVMPPTTFDTLLAFEPLSFWSGLNHALGLTPAMDVNRKGV